MILRICLIITVLVLLSCASEGRIKFVAYNGPNFGYVWKVRTPKLFGHKHRFVGGIHYGGGINGGAGQNHHHHHHHEYHHSYHSGLHFG